MKRLSKLVNINSIRQRHHFLLKKSTLRLHTIVGLADFFVSVSKRCNLCTLTSAYPHDAALKKLHSVCSYPDIYVVMHLGLSRQEQNLFAPLGFLQAEKVLVPGC